jgi:hypothetical protein
MSMCHDRNRKRLSAQMIGDNLMHRSTLPRYLAVPLILGLLCGHLHSQGPETRESEAAIGSSAPITLDYASNTASDATERVAAFLAPGVRDLSEAQFEQLATTVVKVQQYIDSPDAKAYGEITAWSQRNVPVERLEQLRHRLASAPFSVPQERVAAMTWGDAVEVFLKMPVNDPKVSGQRVTGLYPNSVAATLRRIVPSDSISEQAMTPHFEWPHGPACGDANRMSESGLPFLNEFQALQAEGKEVMVVDVAWNAELDRSPDPKNPDITNLCIGLRVYWSEALGQWIPTHLVFGGAVPRVLPI